MTKNSVWRMALVSSGAGAALIVACGSSSSDAGTTNDADSGVTADGGDAASVDGATESDGDVPANDGGALFGSYDGHLVFTRAPDVTSVFGGAFYDDLAGCTVSTNGSCITTSCRIVPLADAGPEVFPAAGTLTLTGGAFGAGTPVAPNAQGIYDDELALDAGPPFSAGDTLGVSASGGAVAAFTQSIAAPGCITLTSPAIDADAGSTADGTAEISTAHDIALAWSGGQAGSVVFASVYGITADGTTEVSTSCELDATAGHGTIPQASLAPLTGLSPGFFAYGQANVAVFTTGGKRVLLHAGCEAAVGADL